MNGKASGGNHGSGNSGPCSSLMGLNLLASVCTFQSCLCHVCRSNYLCNWFVVLQVLLVLYMQCYHSVILNTFRPNPSKESSLNLHLINVPICCWCGKSPTLLVRTKHHPWRCSSKERSRLVLYLAFDMFQCMFMSPSYLSLLSFPRPSSQTVRLQTVWQRWSWREAEYETTNIRWMVPEMLQQTSCPSSIHIYVWWVFGQQYAVHAYRLTHLWSGMQVGCRCLSLCGSHHCQGQSILDVSELEGRHTLGE